MFAHILKAGAATSSVPGEVPGGYSKDNQCYQCKWFHPESGVTCSAFEDGIPVLILLGEFDHSVPYELEGLSDEGILFEPLDNSPVSGSIASLDAKSPK